MTQSVSYRVRRNLASTCPQHEKCQQFVNYCHISSPRDNMPASNADDDAELCFDTHDYVGIVTKSHFVVNLYLFPF